MNEPILVLNCGSSSIKFALFDADVLPLPRKALWSGQVDGIGKDKSYSAALQELRASVVKQTGGQPPAAVVHRVVHGGTKYSAPVRVDAAVLGGLDMLAFTAGIGEHSTVLRERICVALSWLGLELDPEANSGHASTISRAGSRVLVAVEPTNEEWIAASHAVRVLSTETCDVPQP